MQSSTSLGNRTESNSPKVAIARARPISPSQLDQAGVHRVTFMEGAGERSEKEAAAGASVFDLSGAVIFPRAPTSTSFEKSEVQGQSARGLTNARRKSAVAIQNFAPADLQIL